ncbi:MAG: hypothetical protein ACKVU2_14115 [Saprospiraceae bacterium]
MKNRERLSMIALGVLLFGTNCQQKTEPPTLPDPVVSRIMADLFVAEAATNGLSGYSKDSLTEIYYRQVFDMHQVSKAEYEKNVRIISLDELHIGAVVDSAVALLK